MAGMPIETLIARWVAVLWLVFGLSHVLYPAQWAALFLPLRERKNAGLLLGTFNLPIGLAIILGHNVWVWGIPVFVTLAGWLTTLKSVIYLMFPSAFVRIVPDAGRLTAGFRIIGLVMMVLGVLVAYDAFRR
jgi:uncharacterized protein YjeT (DUF2065 family)